MSTPVLSSPNRWRGWFSRHVLLLSIVFLVPAFLLTRWLVAAYDAYDLGVAAEWYQQGERDLRGGRLTEAVDDYRAALAHARENRGYRLRLAQALERAGALDAASADLRRLWEGDPSNSVVNLELARVSRRQGGFTDAVRYYNNAIYGVWPGDAAARRRDTQLELIDYLLANHRNADALAGLIALAADLPPDAGLRMAVGTRMLKAGAEQEALQEFRQAATLDPQSASALSAAGSLALRLGQFADAERDLGLAVRAGDESPATAKQLSLARAVLDLDPFAPRLGSAQRVRRVRDAFDLATASFGRCVAAMPPGEGAVQDAAAALHARLADAAKPLRGREAADADLQQDTMDLVFDIEEFVASHCALVSGNDEALLALGRSRRGQR